MVVAHRAAPGRSSLRCSGGQKEPSPPRDRVFRSPSIACIFLDSTGAQLTAGFPSVASNPTRRTALLAQAAIYVGGQTTPHRGGVYEQYLRTVF
ncbi:hypothetical protein NDU88_002133 [Pleurodeles waltl]|uniref:Uncharacterized protein n=1 Tax=Pleurodeles waltl TaxID=8319 RepID=A0AAV7LES1_PLEWA|nr:hypothetical protein NDU88_002133 [Pleurodeles waltl]